MGVCVCGSIVGVVFRRVLFLCVCVCVCVCALCVCTLCVCALCVCALCVLCVCFVCALCVLCVLCVRARSGSVGPKVEQQAKPKKLFVNDHPNKLVKHLSILPPKITRSASKEFAMSPHNAIFLKQLYVLVFALL